jgi:hypothetical protein
MPDWEFSDLSALYINRTLKRSPAVSNTQARADLSIAVMERHGVSVEPIRAVDHEIATGCSKRLGLLAPPVTFGRERDGSRSGWEV